jgi:hypothetical protein
MDVSKLSLFLKSPGAKGGQVLNDPSSFADGISFYFQFHFSFLNLLSRPFSYSTKTLLFSIIRG